MVWGEICFAQHSPRTIESWTNRGESRQVGTFVKSWQVFHYLPRVFGIRGWRITESSFRQSTVPSGSQVALIPSSLFGETFKQDCWNMFWRSLHWNGWIIWTFVARVGSNTNNESIVVHPGGVCCFTVPKILVFGIHQLPEHLFFVFTNGLDSCLNRSHCSLPHPSLV